MAGGGLLRSHGQRPFSGPCRAGAPLSGLPCWPSGLFSLSVAPLHIYIRAPNPGTMLPMAMAAVPLAPLKDCKNRSLKGGVVGGRVRSAFFLVVVHAVRVFTG